MRSGGLGVVWAESPWLTCSARNGCSRMRSLATAAGLNGGLHHPAKVRRVIQLFMNGGVSQMDTFDYKPELARRHGQEFQPGEHVEAPHERPGKLMKCPFPFRQHGESGKWVSAVFRAWLAVSTTWHSFRRWPPRRTSTDQPVT